MSDIWKLNAKVFDIGPPIFDNFEIKHRVLDLFSILQICNHFLRSVRIKNPLELLRVELFFEDTVGRFFLALLSKLLNVILDLFISNRLINLRIFRM
jgi:hypothetical protein